MRYNIYGTFTLVYNTYYLYYVCIQNTIVYYVTMYNVYNIPVQINIYIQSESPCETSIKIKNNSKLVLFLK